MAYLITFDSNYFDLENEKPNPINPIHGHSLGLWLTKQLKEKSIDTTDVDAEDWGWYIDVSLDNNKYLVGFIAHPAESESEVPELMVQIHKQRSFKEVITFKGKMDSSDKLLNIISEIINNFDSAKNIDIQHSA